jgi:hypothetical protein
MMLQLIDERVAREEAARSPRSPARPSALARSERGPQGVALPARATPLSRRLVGLNQWLRGERPLGGVSGRHPRRAGPGMDRSARSTGSPRPRRRVGLGRAHHRRARAQGRGERDAPGRSGVRRSSRPRSLERRAGHALGGRRHRRADEESERARAAQRRGAATSARAEESSATSASASATTAFEPEDMGHADEGAMTSKEPRAAAADDDDDHEYDAGPDQRRFGHRRAPRGRDRQRARPRRRRAAPAALPEQARPPARTAGQGPHELRARLRRRGARPLADRARPCSSG